MINYCAQMIPESSVETYVLLNAPWRLKLYADRKVPGKERRWKTENLNLIFFNEEDFSNKRSKLKNSKEN